MKHRVYLIKNADFESSTKKNQLVEVTGEEFYRHINATGNGKRYFICITDNIFYETAEIIIEVSLADYNEWKKKRIGYTISQNMTLWQATAHFGISVAALHKRKEKILKKMKSFW